MKNPMQEITEADVAIAGYLDSQQSFSMIAGAGSGKTSSLITALKHLRKTVGSSLRRDSQKIACVTYTNRAVDVISSRLSWDELFQVSTLHKFLWREVSQFTPDIREALKESIIPEQIAKKQNDNNGGESKKAIAARERIAVLKESLELLNSVESFAYSDSKFSDYGTGQLSHDDVVAVAAFMISNNEIVRQIIGQKYPYVFVDEAQDTFENVVEALNKLCEPGGLPVIGYFGDPMQQIYDKRAGDFHGPTGSEVITKKENYRCSKSVIQLLNAVRPELQQYAAGASDEGTVMITLVEAEAGAAPRKKYTEEQIVRAAERFGDALENWGWRNKDDVKQLFLVRRMIARRLGFPVLHELFVGELASSTAKDDFESGEHFLTKPFVEFLCPLMKAIKNSDDLLVLDLLREHSPAFDTSGENASKTIAQISELANKLTSNLATLWRDRSTKEILKYCQHNQLLQVSRRLDENLSRNPRDEDYDSEKYSFEKSDWLSDKFLTMSTEEIELYVDFIQENTPFSTQHGVKGEEYSNVVVVFDDTEAAWTNYSFAKVLAPDTSGVPSEGQRDRSKKLAYVCFSRAEENLRIVLFTTKPEGVAEELKSKKLFTADQITILNIETS